MRTNRTPCGYRCGGYTSGAREYHYYTATTTRDDCYETTINYGYPRRRVLHLVPHETHYYYGFREKRKRNFFSQSHRLYNIIIPMYLLFLFEKLSFISPSL